MAISERRQNEVSMFKPAATLKTSAAAKSKRESCSTNRISLLCVSVRACSRELREWMIPELADICAEVQWRTGIASALFPLKLFSHTMLVWLVVVTELFRICCSMCSEFHCATSDAPLPKCMKPSFALKPQPLSEKQKQIQRRQPRQEVAQLLQPLRLQLQLPPSSLDRPRARLS